MKKVLFVCAGNICRSPMAEAFFNRLAGERELPLRAESAGLYPVMDQATEEAIEAASAYGVDLFGHQSRQLSEALVSEADLILAMTEMHTIQIEDRFADARGKTFTLLGFIGENGNIADPYGQSLAEYRRCAHRIWAAVEKVVDRLRVSFS
jgi:protein-tyrosine-phosphatase